jgi:hypothetical protein
MNYLADILGMTSTLVMFFMVGTGVLKLFQLATDVREMKDALLDIRRSTKESAHPFAAPTAASGTPTPEELVRSVHAQSYGDEFPL